MIELVGVSCGYGEVLPLKDFSFSLPQSGVVAVLGPSGSGKSTLLKLLAGTINPVSGRVCGLEGQRVSMVFQEDRLLGRLSVALNVAIATDAVPPARVRELLELVELLPFAKRRAAELSGGQQRRVALARALCFGGDVLLLDEPFTGIEPELKARIAAKMKGAFRLVVIATHSREEAAMLGEGPLIQL